MILARQQCQRDRLNGHGAAENPVATMPSPVRRRRRIVARRFLPGGADPVKHRGRIPHNRVGAVDGAPRADNLAADTRGQSVVLHKPYLSRGRINNVADTCTARKGGSTVARWHRRLNPSRTFRPEVDHLDCLMVSRWSCRPRGRGRVGLLARVSLVGS
jgi:hypothetical protein